jgi:hypothetical protein
MTLLLRAFDGSEADAISSEPARMFQQPQIIACSSWPDRAVEVVLRLLVLGRNRLGQTGSPSPSAQRFNSWANTGHHLLVPPAAHLLKAACSL